MAGHSSERRWEKNLAGDIGVSVRVRDAARNLVFYVNEAEEAYQEMLELFQFAGASDQDLANQLFREQWTGRGADPRASPVVPGETEANAVEVNQVADVRATLQAMHQLYLAMNGEPIATSDRVPALRRMT